MPILILLFSLLAGCSSKEVDLGPRTLSPEVIKTVDHLERHTHQDLQVTYSAVKDNCTMTWRILRDINTQGRRYTLDLRQSQDPCHTSLAAVAATHELILTRLFKDFPAASIKCIATGGLLSLDGTGEWNKIMAQASLQSAEWKDWVKNYPKHKSQKSSNEIFLEVLLQEHPHGAFKRLLAKFDLNFEVYHVEKVFTAVTEQAPRLRAMRDAGVMWWEPLSRNPER